MIYKDKSPIKKSDIGYVVPKNYVIRQFGTKEFVSQVKKFLLENFEGAYDSEGRCDAFRYIYISPEGFAYFLRTVLKEIYGNELLLISISLEYDKLYFDLKFDTERLSEEGRKILAFSAEKSGFEYVIEKDRIRVKIKVHPPEALEVRAGKEQLIYNALMDIFFGLDTAALNAVCDSRS